MSTCTKNTYRPEVVAGMIKNVANCNILSPAEQLAFNSLVQNLGFNLCSIETQIATLKATMLSKISNAFLERENHHFSGLITFSGGVKFCGSVTPWVTHEELNSALNEFNGAEDTTLDSSNSLQVELDGSSNTGRESGAKPSAYGYYSFGNPNQVSEFNLALKGNLTSSGKIGSVRTFSTKTSFVQKGAKLVPPLAITFTVDSHKCGVPGIPQPITNVELNSLSLPTIYSFIVYNFTVVYLNDRYHMHSTSVSFQGSPQA